MNTSAMTTTKHRLITSNDAEENLNRPQPGSDRNIDDFTLAVENNPFKSYMNNPSMLAELIFCTFFLAISFFAPEKLFRLQVYEREIPYQITQNGDFLFDQYINRLFSENETIPDWLVVVMSFILPTLIIIVTGLISNTKNDGHSGICSLFFALGSTEFITSFVKLYCGYFRPNFYSYCDFSEDTFTCNLGSNEPRKSFPSGHASMSFCAMTVLTLFFYGKIGLHRGLSHHLREGRRNENYYKKRIFSVVAASPMLLAVFIAASRVHDDWHHPADIVGGAIIGLSTAIFGYGLWYPSIYSQFAGCPLQTAFNEFEER